jgi:hypothetical protein
MVISRPRMVLEKTGIDLAEYDIVSKGHRGVVRYLNGGSEPLGKNTGANV